MSEELKPCPFCGGEVKTIYYYDGFGVEYFGVHCEHCRFTYGAETEYKRNTANRWNTRAVDWRRTREQKPETCEVVLAYTGEDNGIYIEACAEVLEWTGEEFFDYRHSFVGHTPEKAPFWMCIPDLPEVEE